MTPEMWLTLAILGVAIAFFVTERLRVDVVALGVVVTLMLTQLLTPKEALSGFSNPAVLTIAGLFVVGGAVMQTGLAGAIGRRILRVSGTSETRLLIAVMISVALLSSVMSDTGTVAVLMPAIVGMAISASVSPRLLLLPLAYGALLGGAMTLIGTPPNIIVSDLLASAGYEPFGFFSFTPVGATLLVVGVVYMLTVGRRLLPKPRPGTETPRVASPDELVDLYRLPDNLFHLRVRRASGLVDRTLGDSALRSTYGVTVLEVHRPSTPRPRRGPLRLRMPSRLEPDDQPEQIVPAANTVLQLDDVLVVRGEDDDVFHAAASWNLGVQPAEPDEDMLVDDEAGIAEVLLPPRSSLLGKTLSEAKFAQAYQLTVIGISRPGSESLSLDDTVLRFGDMLLVQGRWHNILALKDHRRDFVVMGQPEAMLGAPNREKAPLAMLVLALMVVLIATGLVSLATASLLAALLVVLTGCLSMDQAYEAIDWRSIVLIAGMIPMSVALEKVGLVDLLAQWLTNTLGDAGPLVAMAGLFLLTSAMTQVLSNTATTVLIAPIALATAAGLGAEPHAFVMSVAVAASMAFASPVASPVNTLVMGAGDYRFSDYLRVGVPLMVLALIVTLIVVPFVFPL